MIAQQGILGNGVLILGQENNILLKPQYKHFYTELSSL